MRWLEVSRTNSVDIKLNNLREKRIWRDPDGGPWAQWEESDTTEQLNKQHKRH